MKKLLVSAVILSSMGLYAQSQVPPAKQENGVGINTTEPRATLDVNGDLRLQEVKKMESTTSSEEIFPECKPCLLLIDKFGVVKRVTKKEFLGGDSQTGGGSGSGSGGSQGGGSGSGGSQGGGNVGGGATFASLSDAEAFVLSYDLGSTANEKLQGKVTSTEIPVKIPYTGGSTNKTVEETIIASATIPNLKLKIKAGVISSASGELDAVIYHENGEYDVPQITLSEVQNGNYKKEIATFQVQVNGVTQPATVTLNALGGIPDRKFGEQDGKHKFLYLPVEVTGPNYSETWLNMNLGAEAAKVGSPDFNLTLNLHGPDAHQEEILYGSLYQWQRPTDGHEFRNSGTTRRLATTWEATTPEEVKGNFIIGGGSNWKSGGESDTSGINVQLWQKDGTNNPCPVGYHVPTQAEWQAFHKLVTGVNPYADNNKMEQQKYLPNLPAAGYRHSQLNRMENVGDLGFYWTSTTESGNIGEANVIYFKSTRSEDTYDNPRMVGASVRCIKDK